MSRLPRSGFAAISWILIALPLQAVTVPDNPSPVAAKETRHPDLYFPDVYQQVSQLPVEAAARASEDLASLGIAEQHARLDVRGGRWGTLMLSQPLIPGDGVGNTLRWGDEGKARPKDIEALERAAWVAFVDFLVAHEGSLRIALDELAPASRAVAHPGGEVVQIYAPRTVDGIPVRSSYLTAVINHGNLVLAGSHGWGDIAISTRPQLSLADAAATARAYLEPLAPDGAWDEPELLLLPMAARHDAGEIEVGQGYVHRLAWAIRPLFDDDLGRWEVLVDAHDGEVLAFENKNRDVAREVKGGVYPLMACVEQPGWPMPFDNVLTPAVVPTDSGGNFPGCYTGLATSMLDGQFVRINDSCGASTLTAPGDLDFGASAGTDCVTPGVGGPGNTHAARTAFYELNRIKAMARGQLPNNSWLQAQLTANVNLNLNCAAFWNGSTVNFSRSGGGCQNTGEIAGVIDHEWGHGMDDNDVNPTISNPGEGIADVYAALRLNSSCIGTSLLPGACSGFGNPCIAPPVCTPGCLTCPPVCNGARDIDWANRLLGTPTDVTWIAANCGFGSSAPCGGIPHCEGAVVSESIWDLFTRDLQALPFSMDPNTAREVTTRLTYCAAGVVGTWFQCTPPFGGCSSGSGYLNFLACDDDNGNINDGTPHMTAIFAAFNRHQIACGSPTPQDSGCAGAPVSSPGVLVTGIDNGASLSWAPVPGATKYRIFRTDTNGLFNCDFGKEVIAETTGTSLFDFGLQNGRQYSYIVMPIGTSDICMGPASGCNSVIPMALAGPPQFGTETIDEVVRSVTLSGFSNPIVVMGPPSRNGRDPSTVRVRNVTAAGFEHYLQEWDYLNGLHTLESAGYLALERGTTNLGGLRADASSVSVDDTWTAVGFSSPFSSPPVVLTQVATENDPAAVTVRVRNVSSTGFELMLQEEEASAGSGHAFEDVHYVAIEPGTATIGCVQLLVGNTGNSVRHPWFNLGFGVSIPSPVFLASMQTTDGINTAALRHRNLTATGVDVRVEEERSADPEIRHTTEDVGFVVLSDC